MALASGALIVKLGQNPFGSDNEWIVDYVNNVVRAESFWRAVAAGKPPECGPIIARFGRFVQPDPSGCWLWTGSRSGSWKGGQHGQFSLYHGEHIYAHRFAFLIFNGPIVSPLVRHSCDVGWCVNPSHLLNGTQLDNMRDAVERARLPKFRQHRKLTPEHVVEIRRLRMRGRTLAAIAEQFGVTKAACSLICAGKRRMHLAPMERRAIRRSA